MSVGCKLQGAILSEGLKLAWAKKSSQALGLAHCLEKVLGNFDGRECLGNLLASLHVRLPGGMGWVGAWKRGWVGSLEKVLGNFDVPDCLGKVLAR